MAQQVPPKVAAMARINQGLRATPLVKARVWNPQPSLSEWPKTSDYSEDSNQRAPGVPQVIPDSVEFAKLKLGAKNSLEFTAKAMKFLKPEDKWNEVMNDGRFQELRGELKKAYLAEGDKFSKTLQSGVCTMFTCGAIGWLARHPDALEPGSVVELFQYLDSGQGHGFAVVNRDRTKSADNVDLWGANCYVIDPWYARHRITTPGSDPVKDLTPQGSVYYDKDFVKFLKDAKERVPQVAFTHEELRKMFTG